MVRKAFLMFLKPGAREEYQRRHDAIWPELAATLTAHGVHSYSIFHDPERDLLFASVELESIPRWEAIATTDVCQRWWAHMRDLMQTNPDNSPRSQDLNEVFHLQEPACKGGKV
jgi:L-rhamnose mutarotase